MAAVTNLLTINIVFMFLQCACCVDSKCGIKRIYKRLTSSFNIIPSGPQEKTFKVVKPLTILECGQLCTNEVFCQLWTFSDGKCRIFHSMMDNIEKEDTPAEVYCETGVDDKWTKIFFMEKGSEFSVMPAFLGRMSYKDLGTEKWRQNFRSNLIDIWNSLPIDQIKLSVIKNDREVKFIIFNGPGTSASDWFEKGTSVVTSSWIDLPGTNYGSTMPIAPNSGSECSSYGWISVVEGSASCSWEIANNNLSIYYSGKDKATQWSKELENADALAVHLSFK